MRIEHLCWKVSDVSGGHSSLTLTYIFQMENLLILFRKVLYHLKVVYPLRTRIVLFILVFVEIAVHWVSKCLFGCVEGNVSYVSFCGGTPWLESDCDYQTSFFKKFLTPQKPESSNHHLSLSSIINAFLEDTGVEANSLSTAGWFFWFEAVVSGHFVCGEN